MNGLEKILARIAQDGEAKAQAALEEARQEAQEVEENFRVRGERVRAQLIAQGEEEGERRAQRLASAAALEGRQLLLAAKQEVLEEAFAQALEVLRGMPQEEYVAFLTKNLAAAAPEGRGQVVFNAGDRARLGKEVVAAANDLLGEAGQLTLAPECREMAGGFVLRDGSVEVNCALETLVEQQRPRLTGELAVLLFPQ